MDLPGTTASRERRAARGSMVPMVHRVSNTPPPSFAKTDPSRRAGREGPALVAAGPEGAGAAPGREAAGRGASEPVVPVVVAPAAHISLRPRESPSPMSASLRVPAALVGRARPVAQAGRAGMEARGNTVAPVNRKTGAMAAKGARGAG